MPSTETADGVSIYYKDWGSGRPVVFSHGWPLNADAWDPQLNFIASHGYRVVAHDPLEQGGWPPSRGDGHDMNDSSPTTSPQLIDTLNLSNATLVGHSTGGGEVDAVPGQARHVPGWHRQCC